MGTFEEGLWARLVQEQRADQVVLSPRPRRRGARPVVLSAGAAVAAATLAVVLGLSVTASTPPAYALALNSDGSVTVTIHDLTTAIPALNAKFAQMGIDETVIPVQAGCSTPGLIAYPGATMSETLTLTPGRNYLAPGDEGVLAAEQLPNGKVALTVGAQMPPLPSCFSNVPATSFPPRNSPGS
ncbi:MAG TPA: hypothetical protein VIK04_10265 [Solirubrobacteraceae bacterium]